MHVPYSCRLSVILFLSGASMVWADAEGVLRERVQPLLVKYCFDCHGDGAAEGGLELDKYRTVLSLLENRDVWWKVEQKLAVDAMPPKDAMQPSPDERAFLVDWVRRTTRDIDCERYASPGRVTLRRLNRAEYRNTVRDLFGVDYEPAAEFPADDVGYGFDNIGDVLSLPPLLLEKYLEAAEAIADQVIVTERGPRRVLHLRGDQLAGPGSNYRDGARNLFSQGELKASVEIPQEATFEILVEAFGQQAGGEPTRMALRVADRRVKTFTVEAVEQKPSVYRYELRLPPGTHELGVSFINDYYRPGDPDPANRDRNLVVRSLGVHGPLEVREEDLPATHRAIFFTRPSDELSLREAARRVVGRLASRVFRRPATDDEVRRLAGLVEAVIQEEEGTFESGVHRALQAMLISPHFLYRVEEDPPPGQIRRLNHYELASRLSYFLWSTMPDGELMRLAREGRLHEGATLRRQVRRMLADERAAALVDNFASQWLQLRKFDEVEPSQRHFPAFSDRLRADMRKETRMFFDSIVREDRSILELLTADYTFANERLARYYGLSGVRGEAFQRVSLKDAPRRGVLTQGAILTVTSNPTRTSPVKRGKWILENLLGEPPPPPPPNVPELVEEGEPLKGTLRQQMEQHRANPNCAVCHQQMDELGFGLENFDAVGSWRNFDGPHEIDASGVLPDGQKFNGPRELIETLARSRQQAFVRCFTEKLLTFALGRGLEYYDQCAVDGILERAASSDYRFAALVEEIVRCDAFQQRAAPPESKE